MEFNAESLKAGLPVIKEVPNCAKCHGPRAMVVTNEFGIICGHCVVEIQNERNKLKDFIVIEAYKKMEEQNGRKALSPLQE